VDRHGQNNPGRRIYSNGEGCHVLQVPLSGRTVTRRATPLPPPSKPIPASTAFRADYGGQADSVMDRAGQKHHRRNIPTLRHSNTPPLRHSATPSLQHSITPPLRHSATPPLQHSNTPPLHHSNTPSLQHSNTPTLQHSNTPTLQHSNTPTLQHSNTPTLHHSITRRTIDE
jgi:hypothetical protein